MRRVGRQEVQPHANQAKAPGKPFAPRTTRTLVHRIRSTLLLGARSLPWEAWGISNCTMSLEPPVQLHQTSLLTMLASRRQGRNLRSSRMVGNGMGRTPTTTTTTTTTRPWTRWSSHDNIAQEAVGADWDVAVAVALEGVLTGWGTLGGLNRIQARRRNPAARPAHVDTRMEVWMSCRICHLPVLIEKQARKYLGIGCSRNPKRDKYAKETKGRKVGHNVVVAFTYYRTVTCLPYGTCRIY
jgi:hypothetical protein